MVVEKSTVWTYPFFTVNTYNFNLSLVLWAEICFWNILSSWGWRVAYHWPPVYWWNWGWSHNWSCRCWLGLSLLLQLVHHPNQWKVFREISRVLLPLYWCPNCVQSQNQINFTYSWSSGQKNSGWSLEILSISCRQAVQYVCPFSGSNLGIRSP